MKIMIDNSPTMIDEKQTRFGVDLWQLRTPLTRYKITDRSYGLDNGCFAKFNQKTWEKQLIDARDNNPIFVCAPDIVGDAARTLDLFNVFANQLKDLPIALVLQDGIGNFLIPWDKIDAVFVGGTDSFKISSECLNCLKVAKILNKWIHIGRVNTPDRVNNFIGIADSIDGSGISKYDHMLENVIKAIKYKPNQIKMEL